MLSGTGHHFFVPPGYSSIKRINHVLCSRRSDAVRLRYLLSDDSPPLPYSYAAQPKRSVRFILPDDLRSPRSSSSAQKQHRCNCSSEEGPSPHTDRRQRCARTHDPPPRKRTPKQFTRLPNIPPLHRAIIDDAVSDVKAMSLHCAITRQSNVPPLRDHTQQ